MSTLTVPEPTVTSVPSRSGARGLLRDTGIVMLRELRPLVRDRSR